jgi:hypothetical protein
MRLAKAAESWHCGLAQNLEVFKAEADFVSDCRQLESKFAGKAKSGRMTQVKEPDCATGQPIR